MTLATPPPASPAAGTSPRRRARRLLAGVAGLAVASSGLAVTTAAPAAAEPDGSDLVINEVYGGGGNSGAPFNADYVELYNPTDEPIGLAGKSLQYRSAAYQSTQTPSVLPLDAAQQVPAGDSFLVKVSTTGTTGAALAPDQDGSALAMSGTNGQVILAATTTAVTATGDLSAASGVIDMVGYGASNTAVTSYETNATGEALSSTLAAVRATEGVDTDDNAPDFTSAAPSPTAAEGDTTAPPQQPENLTIAEIQGTGTQTGYNGRAVTTEGVVTAAYPTGGFNGFVIQTGGTGGALGTRSASDAIFVYGGQGGFDTYPAVGDSVEVTGTAGEFNGLTQITPGDTGSVTALDTPLPAVTPTTFSTYPATSAARETVESMLVQPASSVAFTVTDTYNINSFGEVGLASGTTPLVQPTETIDAQDTAAISAANAANANRRINLDDGASVNYTNSSQSTPLPYLTRANPIRVGSRATITQPVIMDFRNNVWKFQPRSRVTGNDTAPATFTNTRAANAAPRNVGGSVQLATFNVLNYFPTTGVEWIDEGPADCSAFDDRQGNPITVDSCDPDGPRGAWDEENLARQEVKIVKGILGTNAEVVALEEIENSARFGKDRDFAVSRLVDALNASAGAGTWAFVPSPDASQLPDVADQDVIRNAIIYKRAAVRTVGASASIGDEPVFANAREPMAQVFRPVGSGAASEFAVVVNHFKSKSTSGATGDNVDTGQGGYNGDRTRQATALAAFADEFAADREVEAVFLTGDFNSYTQEDPMQVLYGEGYRKISSDQAGDYSYSFSGLSGSLDHFVGNAAARGLVTGADYWSINSGESIAFEYSRYNYNRTQFYEDNVFRASDHDPMVVGINPAETEPTVDLTIVSTNDFHGRINNSTSSDGAQTGTAQYAGTIEQIRENAPGGRDHTLLLGNGDLYGASEFNSAINEDVPTFDVFNALGMAGSSVGNHEFDAGYDDLVDRVGVEGDKLVDYPYLGANVYEEGTTTPALPEYATYEIDGVTIGAIGVVTQETPSLVSPAGIEGLEFGDAAEAADRVAAQLSDGDDSNGEADVIVLLAHAGGQGFAEDATYEQAIAATDADSEFQQLAGVSDDIDAIFNGHTHQVYALRQPNGAPRGRAIVQAGQYGEHVGRVTMTYDRDTEEVTTRTIAVRDRVTTPRADLIDRFPVVGEVQQIVDQAIRDAAVVGNVPVGRISADITRARTSSGTEDRGDESPIGELVGNALRDGLPESAGTPDLGVVNPGGLRADLTFAGNTSNNPQNTDGVVTYAEANTVLPFTNNVSLVDLTGEQLLDVMEQQFQPAGADRPYLHLGLSDNVQVTTDRTAPEGERITSVRIDGEALDPAETYTVSTFSFLAAGGDNFTAFAEGDARDTGLVDRDVWIGYLQDTSQGEGSEPIAPDFARQQVDETNLPAELATGTTETFTLSRLDMRAGGAPTNTAVTATLVAPDGTETDLGQVGTVAGGTSEISVDVPADAPEGSVVDFVANPSGTTVTVPVAAGDEPPVGEPVDPTLKVVANPRPRVAGEPINIVTRVTAERDGVAVPVTGTVTVTRDGRELGSGEVDANGRFKLTRTFGPGEKTVEVTFDSAADDVVADGGPQTLTFRVVRQ
ncbi:ExeM/NucH family extracellular endonuclease [Nocardioides sp. CFH 31398]|uniref:ExeM/NucH family extracellular endonuclease n=1 Tax=Nocardioides sp. CFH 31398 TaxID=2919579 RepID=UPI001F055090|nr:ExeM/NucH family extracellular endonuclease [Nocardioides sp. CFH 31398]MCH1867491.1 ExeM/NucH family extracellular endonuclease [Nocardioides sp. CFH 31398]